MSAIAERPEVGSLLRDWCRRRRMSQLELALEAGRLRARHLSFLETGRSRPSAEMVQQLAETLEVPLRERNGLLLAAGYAPAYAQRDLDEPEMSPVREAIDRVLRAHEPIDRVLRAHEPYPAVVVDRHWGMVAGNRSVPLLTEGVAPHLLEPPVNVGRVSLHPEGVAPRILNLPEWRAHLLDRLGREAVAYGDPALSALHDELVGYQRDEPGRPPDLLAGGIAVPLRLRAGDAEPSFISTATTFGTATDITVSELSIEAFFPADEATSEFVRAWANAS